MPRRRRFTNFEKICYLKRKYDELIYRSERTNIKHRFNYLKKMLEAEISSACNQCKYSFVYNFYIYRNIKIRIRKATNNSRNKKL